jgi:hypothetical protein
MSSGLDSVRGWAAISHFTQGPLATPIGHAPFLAFGNSSGRSSLDKGIGIMIVNGFEIL